MYTYTVKEIPKIYDGDTITVIIDLGFSITTKQIVRLYGIDTPEIRGESRAQGLVSRDYLRERLFTALDEKKTIIIKTHKDKKGKYGRWIGEVFVDGVDINKELVTEGLAIFKSY